MCRTNFELSRVFILVTLLAIGCTSVNYVGRSFDPTTSVDMYFSKEEIEKEYTVIGHAIGSGTFGASNEKIQKKLVEEARSRGADAILITGLGKSHVPVGKEGSTEENQIKASFLKYK